MYVEPGPLPSSIERPNNLNLYTVPLITLKCYTAIKVSQALQQDHPAFPFRPSMIHNQSFRLSAVSCHSENDRFCANCSVIWFLLLALFLAFSNYLSHFLLECRSVFAPHDGGIQVGRTFVIWIGKHGNDRHQDLFHSKDWSPSLISRLLRIVLVLSRWVEDGDAHFPVRVNVWVPHFGCEGHGCCDRNKRDKDVNHIINTIIQRQQTAVLSVTLTWHVGKVLREHQTGLEESSFEKRAVRSHDQDFPLVDIAVVNKSHRHQVDWIFGQICSET